MPTPFTHLAKAQRLIDDPVLSTPQRAFLTHHWGAFLLGNIAPDAHHETTTLKREDTHFFAYTPKVEPLAEDAMLAAHPQLAFADLGETAQAAFLAGYLAHLAVDEVWCEQVVMAFAAAPEWGDRQYRHFLFTSLMCLIDERDFKCLPAAHHAAMSIIEPNGWLPFLPDAALIGWRDVVARQIQPGGVRETLEMMGRIVYVGYDGLVALLNSPERLQSELWDRFTQARLDDAEEACYQHMRHVVCTYLDL